MGNEPKITGIHHVTAITSDAQKNIDFYCGFLGLRLVKLTVNHDDPGSYHLYYGDGLGRPGTLMTFFAWPGAHRGKVGPPQVGATAFSVPNDSMDFWMERLKENKVESAGISERFGQRVLSFGDPDGLPLELVGALHPPGQPWINGPVTLKYAIHGFHGVTLWERSGQKTAEHLAQILGFEEVAKEANRTRFRAPSVDGFAGTVELLDDAQARHGGMGAGTVHHVAFRTPDDSQQEAWLGRIAELGLEASPVVNRIYFHSIYYREPGGILFEIATDGPGMTADESAEELGTKLVLPAWMQDQRAAIEKILPPVRIPKAWGTIRKA